MSRHLAICALLLGLLATIVALTPYERALERHGAAGQTVTTSQSCDAPLTQAFGAGQDATEVDCTGPASRRIILAGCLLVASVVLGVVAYRRQGPLADLVAA
ncbi:MAG: hypothetical protein GY929_02640 [Actinomycetia bacterium]|nr:hypothetical protein [Actinomycetes bacterium]